jgi:hypothetical protein
LRAFSLDFQPAGVETEFSRRFSRPARVPAMPIPLDAPEVLDREFLEIRARLLHIAASLDRLDRAEGTVADDPRLDKIRQAVAILAGDDAARAERIQLLFSRPYDPRWRSDVPRMRTTG